MAATGDDQPLVEVGAVGGEDILEISVPANDMLSCEDLTQRRKARKESSSWRSLRFGVSTWVVQHASCPMQRLAIAETADEGERGIEDEGPDQQHAGHRQPGMVLRRADRHLTTAKVYPSNAHRAGRRSFGRNIIGLLGRLSAQNSDSIPYKDQKLSQCIFGKQTQVAFGDLAFAAIVEMGGKGGYGAPALMRGIVVPI